MYSAKCLLLPSQDENRRSADLQRIPSAVTISIITRRARANTAAGLAIVRKLYVEMLSKCVEYFQWQCLNITVTSYGLKNWGSIHGWINEIAFVTTLRRSLQFIRPRRQWVLGVLPPGIMRTKCEGDYSTSTNNKFKKLWSFIPSLSTGPTSSSIGV
jgi:hypothetical protein